MSNMLTRAFGALNRFMNGLTRRDDPMRYTTGSYLRQQVSGVTISMDSALTISAVWACVMAVTNAISRCPWQVYARKGTKQELLPEDPLVYLLNVRPNPEMTAIALREQLSISALTWGNGYAEIQRDLANRVVALWPLMPHRMQMMRDGEDLGGKLYYLYSQQDGAQKRLEVDDVYHVHGPGITGLVGDNLVARAVLAMGLSAAQERFASTYFGNNTQLGGVLEYAKKLDPKDLEKLRQQWSDRHGGPQKAFKPAILEDGMTWKPYDIKADDAQLVDSRKFSVVEICRFYGVPPHKVMHLEDAHFANIEQQNIEFVGDGVEPWCLRYAQEGDYKLLSDRGARRFTRFDTTRLLQGDFKSRFEGYQIGRRIGVYSTNDILIREGDNPIGAEGDVRLVEANMVTLDRVTAATEPEVTVPDVEKGIATPNERREQLGLKARPDGNELVEAAPASPPPAPGAPEGGSDGTQPSKTAPAKGKDKNAVVREALTAMLEGTFNRYQRRLTNRAADLERGGHPPSRVKSLLASDRIRQRGFLVEDTVAARELAARYAIGKAVNAEQRVLTAADAFDNGQDITLTVEALANDLLEGS
jgi:HK97 family phage portal protein